MCTDEECGTVGRCPVGSSFGEKVPRVEHETPPAAVKLTPREPLSCPGVCNKHIHTLQMLEKNLPPSGSQT